MPNAAMIRQVKTRNTNQRSSVKTRSNLEFENTLQKSFADNEVMALISELEDIRKRYEDVSNKKDAVTRRLSVFETIVRSLRRIDKEQMKLGR